MKKTVKIVLAVLITLILLILGYVIYVFCDYERLPDNLQIDIQGAASFEKDRVPIGEELSISSYNIGFGAYSADYSFFMDGGKESRARSDEAVYENIAGAVKTVDALQSDFMFFQEVDFDATRSYHIDERELVSEPFEQYAHVFSQNYDSPYLLWPLTEPHGANKAGQMTFSKYPITDCLRRSLPIEDGFMKLLDLDRTYHINRIPTENGKELVLFNFHLSAYTSDGKIAEDQLKMLFDDMKKETDKGNYVIAGGDFNKDILGNSPEIFGISGEEYTWAQSIPREIIPDGFRIIAPLDEDNPIASCRNADRPYGKDDFLVTVDGFIISDNIQCISDRVIDTQFRYSDHNPVNMHFILE